MRRFIMVLLLLVPAIAGLGFLYSFKNLGNDYTEFLHRSTESIRQELVGMTSVAMSWRRGRDTLPSTDINALMDRMRSTYANARELFDSQPDKYITAPIERGRFATVVRATGTLNPISTVDVSSELSGRIAEVLVDFNDKVRAGQVLARLDPVTFAARVKRLRQLSGSPKRVRGCSSHRRSARQPRSPLPGWRARWRRRIRQHCGKARRDRT